MKLSKKFFFFAGFSAILIPFFIGLTPINTMMEKIHILRLKNNEKAIMPQFNWKVLYKDSIDVTPDSTIKNSWSLKNQEIKQFTEGVEDYHHTNFGMRSAYVKVRNQLDYTFFNKVNAKSVIIGKEGYLYEKQYIDAYYGRDFIGRDSIENKVDKLKFVQDELQRQGKLVLVVIAPGKGSFYPEYIPEYLKSEAGPTNYKTYLQAFKDKGINYIDFNSDYLNRKGKTQHILYPKNGIHWSQHAMYHSLDSISKFIENKLDIDLPNIKISNNKATSEIKFKDNDIEEGLNLILKLDHPEMSYPDFEIESDETKTRPKVLTIADSFYWQMYDLEISEKLFRDGKFWFYNSAVYPDSKYGRGFVLAKDKNMFEEVLKSDVVLLMASEANMYKFSFGFIEDSHKAIKVGLENYKKRIANNIERIKKDEKWYFKVVKKAENKGVSVDEMLKLDAQYLYNLEINSKSK